MITEKSSMRALPTKGGEDMEEFEALLEKERIAAERFVKFRISSKADAEDVLQEVYLTAYRKFSQLKNRDSFKPWLISIARSKCADYFRRKAALLEIPVGELSEQALSAGRCGVSQASAVGETLDLLGGKDKQILYLYFWKELPQAEIAKRLGIPIGTVKSRLYTAKQNFKSKYPCPAGQRKGADSMKKMPGQMPAYKIEESKEAPFAVKWEELMGWFLVPRLGEKLSWGMYDMPEGKLTESDDMEVVGKAQIHGIEGVEITVKTHNPMECNSEGGQAEVSRRFIAQLTDTHCRYLAESHMRNGVKHCYTFLDGGSFLDNWGFGQDNCGNETNLSPKGNIRRNGSVITTDRKDFLLDIVGRYTVSINGKSYDTVCVMDVETYNNGVASEQFLDKNGRTVLWRRFNRDDWAINRYQKPWSQLLPENERLTIDGVTYVHWYDCITDYIL